MSFLIFCFSLSLVLCLTFFLILCLISLMELTIAHMVLVYERIALCLDALVMVHVFIVVIIFRIGPIFLLKGSRTHFESNHLDGPHFPRHGSCPTQPNGEVQRIVKTSLGHIK
jgi:hypothetical protein